MTNVDAIGVMQPEQTGTTWDPRNRWKGETYCKWRSRGSVIDKETLVESCWAGAGGVDPGQHLREVELGTVD